MRFARYGVYAALMALAPAGCGSKSKVPSISGVQECLDDDVHFAQFIDGVSDDAPLRAG